MLGPNSTPLTLNLSSVWPARRSKTKRRDKPTTRLTPLSYFAMDCYFVAAHHVKRQKCFMVYFRRAVLQCTSLFQPKTKIWRRFLRNSASYPPSIFSNSQGTSQALNVPTVPQTWPNYARPTRRCEKISSSTKFMATSPNLTTIRGWRGFRQRARGFLIQNN